MREELKEQKIKELYSLVDSLNYHTELYNKNCPIISDKEWDDMYFQLVSLENELNLYLSNSSTQQVTYTTVNELKKVQHNHPMLSLDKTKDWDAFVHYFNNKDVVGMLKLDGLTCSLRYRNGNLVGAETRGNGVEGEDIYHNALVIKNIPKRINCQLEEELTIDGEIICSFEDFKAFNKEYANPRNFAAGSIRLLDSNECAKRNLQFVAWHIAKGGKETVIENFTWLDQLGFTVVPWTSSWDWDAKDFLVNTAKEYGYPIDGLVGRFNNIAYGESLGATGHHSRAAYAFKFYDETYETHLNNIEFNLGRTGVLTPVAVFNPVEIEGTIVERASLHNLTIMKELLGTPYKGQTLQIYKAHMIIPQIASAGREISPADYAGLEIQIPKVCPVCGGVLDIECEVDTEILICNNNDCPGRLVNRLDHFCGKKGLDIKGLSKATLEKLIDWGWVNQPADLYRLAIHEAEWTQKPGFGKKSVENILQAIEDSRSPKLDAFISALGIPLIGRSVSKDLLPYIESYEDFRNKAKEKWDFTKIDGIAWEKASAIWHFNFKEADAVDEYMLAYQIDKPAAANNSLAGETIVITGRLNLYKNRNDLQKAIEDRGGKVASSVSKNTNWLINNDISSTSNKNVTAERLGVPIITEQEFFNIFLDN